MTTGDRIKEARLKAGLTQSELAEKIGVKFSAIHKYETGMVVNLKRDTISAIAKALNVRGSWLMCMDDEETDDTLVIDFGSSVADYTCEFTEKLSKDEREIIELIRTVRPDQTELAYRMIRSVISTLNGGN